MQKSVNLISIFRFPQFRFFFHQPTVWTRWATVFKTSSLSDYSPIFLSGLRHLSGPDLERRRFQKVTAQINIHHPVSVITRAVLIIIITVDCANVWPSQMTLNSSFLSLFLTHTHTHIFYRSLSLSFHYNIGLRGDRNGGRSRGPSHLGSIANIIIVSVPFRGGESRSVAAACSSFFPGRSIACSKAGEWDFEFAAATMRFSSFFAENAFKGDANERW